MMSDTGALKRGALKGAPPFNFLPINLWSPALQPPPNKSVEPSPSTSSQ